MSAIIIHTDVRSCTTPCCPRDATAVEHVGGQFWSPVCSRHASVNAYPVTEGAFVPDPLVDGFHAVIEE